MTIIFVYILIAFAAIFNAAMDRTENIVAFNRSIFNHLDAKFWCKEISWRYATKVFGWKADCWHICKSMMIISLISGIIVADNPHWLHFFALGVTWNTVFSLFYHKILYR